jgi:purine catabolism regulator
MDMKVKNLMEQFEGFEVLAGKGGLDRRVSTVTVMDAPDIYNWMKGGEFLITISEIVNLDLNDSEDKFKIELCLKLMNMNRQYSLYMKTSI